MKSVNLIPASRRDAKRRRRHRNACALACAGYAVLLAGAVGTAHLVFTATGETLDDRLAAADNDVRRLDGEAGRVRKELAAARATVEANRTVSEQPDWSVLLALLAKTTGEDVVLRGVTIGPAPAAPSASSGSPAAPAGKGQPDAVLEIMGVGQTQLAVSRHVLRLEGTGLFSKVTLVDTGRESFLNGNAIAFRLQCTFGEPKQALRDRQQAAKSRQTPARSPQAPGGAGAVTNADAGGITR